MSADILHSFGECLRAHTVYVGTDGALFCVYEAVLCHFLKKEPIAPGLWMTKL